MRRILDLVVLSLLLVLTGPAAAHESTPHAEQEETGGLGGLGYPELALQVSEGEIAAPEQVEAGRTLITYENLGPESSHPFLLRVPDDISAEEAIAALGPRENEPPTWFFEATFPGGPGETGPGQTSRVVADLVPGIYIALDLVPTAFEVVAPGATPAQAETQEPIADGTVELFEMGFNIPGALAPGQQVWEVTNVGEVPHELLLVYSPKPITVDQVMELLMSEDPSATPVGGGPSAADIVPAGGVGWLSPGASAWTEVELQEGTYVALCFVFDPETGMPHAMMGMVDVFTVGEEATPVAAIPAG